MRDRLGHGARDVLRDGLEDGRRGELEMLDACGLEEVAHLVAGCFAVVKAESCFPA